MDKEKLLDEYISERFSDLQPILTEEQKKYIANTVGFQGYCLQAAWDKLKAELKQCFPFSLFWG